MVLLEANLFSRVSSRTTKVYTEKSVYNSNNKKRKERKIFKKYFDKLVAE